MFTLPPISVSSVFLWLRFVLQGKGRTGAAGGLPSLCDADTLKALGATGRLAARASLVEVPDRENPHDASHQCHRQALSSFAWY